MQTTILNTNQKRPQQIKHPTIKTTENQPYTKSQDRKHQINKFQTQTIKTKQTPNQISKQLPYKLLETENATKSDL